MLTPAYGGENSAWGLAEPISWPTTLIADAGSQFGRPIVGPTRAYRMATVYSVWGAISEALEGAGGKYVEDVQIAKAYNESEGQWAPGYFPHAYCPEKEKKLWEVLLKLVGEDA